MASKLQIKSKIAATGNVRQITKAMQMVAASKMRKAQESALRARPYAKKGMMLMRHVLRYATTEKINHSFFGKRPMKRLCLVVVTSDRGLCGSLNGSVTRRATRFIRDNPESSVDIVAVGKKGRDFFAKRSYRVVKEFIHFSEQISAHDVSALFDWLVSAYEGKTYDRIFFCSTGFVSVLQQKVELYQLLPLSMDELGRLIENIVPKTGKYSEAGKEKNGTPARYYAFEPTPEEVLERVTREMIRVQILHLLLESAASEHSARMVAMKNASENADHILENLTQTLNKLRQSGITQELAEITTAKEALTAE